MTSIANDINQYCKGTKQIIVCGGGAHNQPLLDLLQQYTQCEISTTETYHIPVDFVEACAFAWLAYQTINAKPGNLCSVTGAKKPVTLGGIFLAN